LTKVIKTYNGKKTVSQQMLLGKVVI
jgi:hypothetical protein